ncbi:EpsG family protein [Alistipes finegoldii]|jgi:hypothetical protein|uniref:EpsG family protein n=1 Tax=Alistipes finegoldii TaxID=214856 RepID=UPI00248BBBB2|nr:EpsG family protein [Alistipes finegoldii]
MPFHLYQAGIYFVLFAYLLIMVLVEFSIPRKHLKYRQGIAGLSALIFVLFIGLRWETGTDWEPYKDLFDAIELDWTFLLNVYHFDIGYVLINALVRFFTESYTIFLLFDAALAIIPLFFLLRRVSPYPNVSLMMFYVNYMIAQFMGSNRRMIAIVLILWFIYYVAVGKKGKSVFALTGAFLFHRSSIANLLIYLVPRKLISAKKVFFLLLVSMIVGLSQIPATVIEKIGSVLMPIAGDNEIVQGIEFYSENGEEHLVYGTGSLILSTILALGKRVIFLIPFMYICKRRQVDQLTIFLLNIYIISFSVYLCTIGSFFQMLTAYWTIVDIILIGRILCHVKGKAKLGICFFLCLYGVLQMTSALNVYPELYMPYLPFWTTIHR